MKDIYILRTSQLTQSNMAETVKAFVKKTGIDQKRFEFAAYKQGGLPLQAYQPEEIAEISQGAIYLFKTGIIDEQEFVKRINEVLDMDLSMDDFKECWNAMCTIQPEVLEYLRDIEILQKNHEFGIHVMASTNTMHVDYVNQQLADAGLDDLKITYTYSFEVGDLEPKLPENLEKNLENNIIDLRKTADILAELNERYFEMEEAVPRRKLSF